MFCLTECLSSSFHFSSQGFWQVESASYSLNGKKIARSGNTCILDTGTTLALVDDTILKQIYGKLLSSQSRTEPPTQIWP
jgi:hypothetical protein